MAGVKNYEFPRVKCPLCGKDVAASRDRSDPQYWLRRHKRWVDDDVREWCPVRTVSMALPDWSSKLAEGGKERP